MARTPSTYNFLALTIDFDGSVWSKQAVQVIDGLVYRAAGHSCFQSGTAAFDAVYQSTKMGRTVRFVELPR
jgi:hypothetical protein